MAAAAHSSPGPNAWANELGVDARSSATVPYPLRVGTEYGARRAHVKFLPPAVG